MFGYESKFIHIVEVGFTNIQSKSEINGLLKSFTLIVGVHWECPLSMLCLLYISAAVKYLQFSLIPTRGLSKLQTGGHVMKMRNFPDNATIFLLRDINCYNRIQSILKSHEKASSSKTKIKNAGLMS